MIQCDKCEEWFHGSCVGVTKQFGRQLEKMKKEWICPKCRDPGTEEEKYEDSNSHGSAIQQKSGTSFIKKSKQTGPSLKNLGRPGTSTTFKNELASGKTKSASGKNSASVKIAGISIFSKGLMKKNKKRSEAFKKQFISNSAAMDTKSKAKTSATTKGKTEDTSMKTQITVKTPTKTQKKLICVQCQKEVTPNTCFCNADCIIKHVDKCLKKMVKDSKNLKPSEFRALKLVVCDRNKGTVITGENAPTVGGIVSFLKSQPNFMIVCPESPLSSPKKDTRVRKESESAVNTSLIDEASKATIRINVRKTLKNILFERCKKAGDINICEDDIQRIAVKIEEELHDMFNDSNMKYRTKYRSLMFNIKDPRNQGLFRKILNGSITPARLVRMSCDELASVELAKWREQENQHSLDMIKRVNLEHQKAGAGLMLKKTHKGEVEIEEDITSVIEIDVPKSIPKEDVQEDMDEETDTINDTTHLHRSHLFDLNCKICTGKVVPALADENMQKKIRVAHSISVDVVDTIEQNISKIVDGKSPASSNDDDSRDQEPTSTVTFESPLVKSPQPVVPKTTDRPILWTGFVFMQDVTKFMANAYKVSGTSEVLEMHLPASIQVCGRIIPDQVWEYLSKIKQSGSKELITILFEPSSEDESAAYQSFYSYLNNRKRYGVVQSFSKKVKDFYIIPLAATSPVPTILMPFDGPGLPSPRSPLLLGVVVKHKNKPAPKVSSSLSSVDFSLTSPSTESRSYTPPLPTSSSCSGVDSDSVKTPSESVDSSQDASPVEGFDSSPSSDLRKVSIATLPVDDDDKPYDPEPPAASLDDDDNKPYDPEQEISPLRSGRKKQPATQNYDQHRFILDALTHQIEETNREVSALEQAISVGKEDDTKSSDMQNLDINSVAASGMSSFMNLPVSLQEILKNVRSKSEKDSGSKGNVDARIKALFPEHLNEESTSDPSAKPSSEEGHSTPSPAAESKSSSALPSDPRLKLRSSLRLSQSARVGSHTTTSASAVSTNWQSAEPPPPGVDPKDMALLNPNPTSQSVVSPFNPPFSSASLPAQSPETSSFHGVETRSSFGRDTFYQRSSTGWNRNQRGSRGSCRRSGREDVQSSPRRGRSQDAFERNRRNTHTSR